jgi:predicted esterase
MVLTAMPPPHELRTIEARVHGRYLLRVPDGPGPWPAIVGFHGQGEDAEIHLSALERTPGTEPWLLVSVQALHPFSTRGNRVVASWMTRQDRELAIEDNGRYVGHVLDAVRRETTVQDLIVFSGFSQGGAMAFRAAARFPAAGVIVLGADVPPDVQGRHVLPPVLLGRGAGDAWYTKEKMAADVARLGELSPSVETCVFDGGHEWSAAFAAAAGAFLDRLRTERR